MKRKLSDKEEPPTKRQKIDPSFCKYGCGRLISPGKTRRGNPFDTCCRQCAKNGHKKEKVWHDLQCNERIYKYKIDIGEIEPVNNWNDVNKRILKKFNKEIGHVITDNLPNDFLGDISNIIIEYVAPAIITRPSWIPQTEEKENCPITASKYGGKPFLKHNDNWPKCATCSNYMPLFIQLNVNDLPNEYKQKYLKHADLWKNNVIQLFYCANSDLCDTGYEAFDGGHMQRVVNIKEKPKDDQYIHDIMKIIREKSENDEIDWENNEFIINGWKKCDKLEGATYEIEDELVKLFGESSAEIDDDNFGEGVLGFIEDNFMNESDKLFGYPSFIQDPEFPMCNEANCNEKLTEMIFQSDAQILDFCWGDVGVGQILCCPNHPFILGFIWQCS